MISIPLFLGQTLASININSPIGELLVLINESFNLFTNLSTETEKLIGSMIQKNIYGTCFANNRRLNFHLRKKITFSLKKITPQAKLFQWRKPYMIIR